MKMTQIKNNCISSVIQNYFQAVGDERRHYNKNSNGSVYYEGDILYSYGSHFPLAIKCRNGYILNGDKYSNSTSKHQGETRSFAPNNSPIIPLSALSNINSKREPVDFVKDVEIIDVTEDDYKTVKCVDPKTGEVKEREVHFLGASVIRYKRHYYLSSIDSGSKNWGAYFLVQLKNKVGTVKDAFRDLAGNLSDKKYKLYQLGDIQRQGEYFLIPTELKTNDLRKTGKYVTIKSRLNVYFDKIHLRTPEINKFISNAVLDGYDTKRLKAIKQGNKEFIIELNQYNTDIQLPKNSLIKQIKGDYILFVKSDKGLIKNFDSSQGVGNAHIATEAIKTDEGLFIRKTLRHRQHKMIRMGNVWHKVVKNTAVNSWSAGGMID